MHMSSHEDGMINKKKTRGGITVGNGEVMVAMKVGDIPCEICDKCGNKISIGTITDFVLTRSSPFNLRSITKMMKLGWTLGGDKTSGITLAKGAVRDITLKFVLQSAQELSPREVASSFLGLIHTIAKTPAMVPVVIYDKHKNAMSNFSPDIVPKLDTYVPSSPPESAEARTKSTFT
jgi:hypothetical protein